MTEKFFIMYKLKYIYVGIHILCIILITKMWDNVFYFLLQIFEYFTITVCNHTNMKTFQTTYAMMIGYECPI